MILDEVAEAMLEARRYARGQPIEAINLTQKAVELMFNAANIGRLKHGVSARIAKNLNVGSAFVFCDPEVLESYLYTAAFEMKTEHVKP